MGLLIIDQDKCKKDGICAKECPMAIIKLKDEESLPILVPGGEDICNSCGHCVAVCPNGALSHERVPMADSPLIEKDLEINEEQAVQFLRSRRSIRFFKKQPGKTRFNYIWDALLFILGTVVFFSGVLVSEAALPFLGLPIEIDPFWSSMHDLTSNLFLVLLGVHLAMHWKWFLDALNRYILRKPNNLKPAKAVKES